MQCSSFEHGRGGRELRNDRLLPPLLEGLAHLHVFVVGRARRELLLLAVLALHRFTHAVRDALVETQVVDLGVAH